MDILKFLKKTISDFFIYNSNGGVKDLAQYLGREFNLNAEPMW